jgi:hypothetical protein
MAKGKAGVATPFESCIGTVGGKKGNPGTYDRNRTPILSKPHSMGSDTIPLKFYEAGKALEPNTEKFATPFGNTLAVKGKKRGV